MVNHRAIVVIVLAIHGGLLVWGSYVDSPTFDEPAHLAAGVSNWHLGSFDLYRVNPPIVRMAAAIPPCLLGVETDWRNFHDGSRAEFEVGKDFIAVNANRIRTLFFLARLACIPFSLLGGVVCYAWALKLYGQLPAFVALLLWCFSPDCLAYGHLITADCGSMVAGVGSAFVFRSWVKEPNWKNAVFAGSMFAVALLIKSMWIIYFIAWPNAWLLWRLLEGRLVKSITKEVVQITGIGAIAILVLNCGYGFEGTFCNLGKFEFTSEDLRAKGTCEGTSNRFRGTILEGIPIPLPKNFVIGLDLQKFDFESAGRPSYLWGRHRWGSWPSYYLVAVFAKEPIGLWLMCAVVFASRIEDWSNRSIFREEAFLALHCATIGIVVASQSGLSQSFRYILPCLPFVFIWASQAMQAGFKVCTFKGAVAAAGLISYIASSLSVSPHWGCHFSELVGGAVHGHECLDGASVDWGHSLWDLKKWLENHKEAVSVKIAVMSLYSPAHLGIFGDEPPHGPLMGAESSSGNSAELGPLPGWYAVSTDRLHSFSGEFAYFLEFEPVEKIGYSIFVYRISVDDANRVRRKMGLSDVQ